MTSFATSAASFGAQWSVVITLEGSGDGNGLYYYCSQAPTYAVDDPNYRPWLRDGAWPDVLSESVNAMGGLPEAGNITVDLVDIDDALTAEWRTERGPITLLHGEVSSTTSTSITVDDASNITVGECVYIGHEAMLVGSKTATTIDNLTRGFIGTDAATQLDGQEVYLSTPYLKGRRIRLYVVPIDADGVSDLHLFGTYHVDSFGLSDDMNSYLIQGRSALKYLDRLISHNPAQSDFEICAVIPGQNRYYFSPPVIIDPWEDKKIYARFGLDNGEEIVLLRMTAQLQPAGSMGAIEQRGALGTKNSGEISEGQPGQLVLAADETEDGSGSFRYIGWAWAGLTPGEKAGISRLSHLWTKSAHWVDIILSILTSSAGDDNIGLDNGSDVYGTWSSLPDGYGLGIPASVIDYESFIGIKMQTPDFKFKNFYLDSTAKAFKQAISEQMLEPIGAYITTETGMITLRMPKIPLVNSSLNKFNSKTIFSRSTGPRKRLPEIVATQDVSKLATTVTFNAKTASGSLATHTFNDTSYEGWSVGRSYYASEEPALVFDVPSIRSEGSNDFLRRLGMRKLFRFRRPLWNINVKTGLDQYERVPGDLIGLDHEELPDTETGLRGWENVACEVTGREISINDTAVQMLFTLLAFTTVRIGRVSASGSIMSFIGPNPSSEYTVTIATNVYTDPNAIGLPTTDAAAFRVNDHVTLCNPDGSDAAAATTQSVVSITGSEIVLDSNFGGLLAAGLILIFSDRATALSTQYNSYVYYAGQTDSPPNIGTSTDKPWRYGE